MNGKCDYCEKEIFDKNGDRKPGVRHVTYTNGTKDFCAKRFNNIDDCKWCYEHPDKKNKSKNSSRGAKDISNTIEGDMIHDFAGGNSMMAGAIHAMFWCFKKIPVLMFKMFVLMIKMEFIFIKLMFYFIPLKTYTYISYFSKKASNSRKAKKNANLSSETDTI